MKLHRIFGILTAAVSLGMIGSMMLPVTAQEISSSSDSSIRIVAEIFPTYDWTRELLTDTGKDDSLFLLLNNGVDLHSYQPTVDDIMTIADSDLLIYIGGETDAWIDDALKEAENPDRQVIRLMDVLSEDIREEEIVEGMTDEHSHEHNHEEEDTHDHDEELDHEEEDVEYDEHVWLSLRNAKKVTTAIADALIALDPENSSVYKKNLSTYLEKLDSLDQAYEEVVSQADYEAILFGDRFPFRYLTEDYNLSYYAAFSGCSAETEASFETIAFLANKATELSLPSILTIDGSDQRIAETIAANTQTSDMLVLTMDSMQATTLKDAENGATYLTLMEQNLEVLKQALLAN